MNKINFFKNEYSFLSNFEPCKIIYNNIEYLSVESAYQAQKTNQSKIKKIFARLDPAESKILGRNIILREDWEEIKYKIMRDLCMIKFSKEPFKSKLINTGDAFLEEGNFWHDNNFGICYCDKCRGIGRNELGKILMEIRNVINNEQMNFNF